MSESPSCCRWRRNLLCFLIYFQTILPSWLLASCTWIVPHLSFGWATVEKVINRDFSSFSDIEMLRPYDAGGLPLLISLRGLSLLFPQPAVLNRSNLWWLSFSFHHFIHFGWKRHRWKSSLGIIAAMMRCYENTLPSVASLNVGTNSRIAKLLFLCFSRSIGKEILFKISLYLNDL